MEEIKQIGRSWRKFSFLPEALHFCYGPDYRCRFSMRIIIISRVDLHYPWESMEKVSTFLKNRFDHTTVFQGT